MLRTLLFLLLGLAAGVAEAQFTCGTDDRMARARAVDPGVRLQEDLLEDFTRTWIADQRSGARELDTAVLVIPVVFHIIHMEGPENISNAQVQSAIDILNRDFRKRNADTITIVNGFDTLASDVRLEFRLATKDPMGNCTNGIERIRSVETLVGDNGSKLNYWWRHQYLNIWVVADMENGVAGYSQYPSAVVAGTSVLGDGVIIRHNYVGAIGTSNPNNSRSLTHEVGHYLNLQHTWGDTNDPGVACGDDLVEDTPITRGWTTCDLNASYCVPGVIENVQNFMEYAYCSRMFSRGQAERMRAALASPVASRNQLWLPTTLAAAGVDGLNGAVCGPLAGLYADDRFVCVGATTRFFDNSTRALVTVRAWTFQDGVPATSTDEQPLVSFTSPGWKTVTLTVSNADGTDTKVDEHAILVGSDWSEVPGALAEPFPTAEAAWSWPVMNWDDNGTSWAWTDAAGADAPGCMRMNGSDSRSPLDLIDVGDNDLDDLLSPTLDLRWLDNAQLAFKYAYATQTTDLAQVTEVLEVTSSKDCGKTWQPLATIAGQDLITGGATSGPFDPGPGDWVQHTVNLPVSLLSTKVRFRFRYVSSPFSSDLYIDDVNILGSVGLDEPGGVQGLAVVPNPNEGLFVLRCDDAWSGPVDVTITDASGRVVRSERARAGDGRIGLHSAALARGVYAATVEHEGVHRSVRFVVR